MVPMKMRSLFVWPVLALAALSAAQSAKPVTVGDPAPPLKVEGWVKGTPTAGLEQGKVYVIEFWATWCGPCISAMPHLSDMADAMKGKAEFISVNVWDRRAASEKEPNDKGHVERVTKFVQDNDAKMRYNIALDDSSDTMSNTWLRAAGRNGIPCAFVVDRTGTIAWIGHPMDNMDKVVEQVVDGKWDTAKFKKDFEAAAAAERKRNEFYTKLQTSAAKSSYDQFLSEFQAAAKEDRDTAISMVPSLALSVTRRDAADGVKFVKYVAANELKGNTMAISQTCMNVANALREKPDQLREIAKISTDNAKKADNKSGAVVWAYHARTLMAAGDKKGAMGACDKAMGMVDSFDPENSREAVRKFVANVKADVEKMP